MPDYNLAKIYRIVCNITGQQYIGSTCEPTLSRRLSGHIRDFRRFTNGKFRFVSSFTVLENGNYEIVLVEVCPCANKDQLHARERYWIETTECVNRQIPNRTQKEWRGDNPEYFRQYAQANKKQIAMQKRQYYLDNKERITEHQRQYRQAKKQEPNSPVKIDIENSLF